MIGRIVIGLLALLIIAGGVVGGVYYWNKMQEPDVPEVAGNAEIALGDEALDLGDTTAPDLDLGGEAVGEAVSLETEPETEGVDVSIGEEDAPLDLSGETTAPEIDLGTTGEASGRDLPRPERTGDTTVPRDSRPVAAAAGEDKTLTGVEIEAPTPTPAPPASEEKVEPTPVPTTPVVVTPTPKPDVPSVPSGNYSVYTMVPVMKGQLQQIRGAMQRLGVQLKEEMAGKQQIAAHRVALGYFRSKEEATSWAKTYLTPKKMQYYVFSAGPMYSIQIGVYSHPQNAEASMRNLYAQFPGWRLPVRIEPTTIGQPTYNLSVRRIKEDLAKRVQSELVRLGVQAELTGSI